MAPKKKRNDILRRKLKRAALIFSGAVFLVWLGGWFYLSGAVQTLQKWTITKIETASVKAGFAVSDIIVVGRIHTDIELIKGLVNMEKGDPLLAFDPGEAQKRLSQINWVKNVRVERRFPGTVYIELTERKPLALWQNNKKLFLIDEEGAPVTDHKLSRFKELITVAGPDANVKAPGMLALLSVEPKLAVRVERADWIGGRRWDLRLKNGLNLKLPEKDIGFALRKIVRAQEKDQLLDKKVLSLDIRDASRIVVRTKPGGVHEYKASFKGKSDI